MPYPAPSCLKYIERSWWRRIGCSSSGLSAVRDAARVLGQLGDARGVDPLTGALRDGNSTVRGAAAMGLGSLKESRAVPALISAVRDEAPDVRSAVAAALGDLRDKQAVPPLIQTLKDEYRMVKLAAALALADIGDKRAVAALTEAVAGEKDEETRTQMKEALQRLMASPD
jgi:HEAT repeat protein